MRKNNSKLKSNNKNLPVPANSLEKYLTEISNYEIDPDKIKEPTEQEETKSWFGF